MSRAVPEWIGKTPDTPAPPRVRDRIFEREGHRCHISGRVIAAGEPWDLDHRIAIINGGENREANLFPALRDKHREKTAEDVALKAAAYAKRSKHFGARAKRAWPKRPKTPAPPQHSATRKSEKTMPRRHP